MSIFLNKVKSDGYTIQSDIGPEMLRTVKVTRTTVRNDEVAAHELNRLEKERLKR